MDKTVKQIILLIIGILILFMGTTMLKRANANDNNNWNYNKNVEIVEKLYSANEINDRTIYWQSKEIIKKFLSTMEDEMYNENEAQNVDYTEYYNVITDRYKKQLSEKEFKSVSEKFITKFLLEDHLGYKYVDDFTILKIYKYGENQYLCFLRSKFNINEGYIGIEFNETQSKFAIFYIE